MELADIASDTTVVLTVLDWRAVVLAVPVDAVEPRDCLADKEKVGVVVDPKLAVSIEVALEVEGSLGVGVELERSGAASGDDLRTRSHGITVGVDRRSTDERQRRNLRGGRGVGRGVRRVDVDRELRRDSIAAHRHTAASIGPVDPDSVRVDVVDVAREPVELELDDRGLSGGAPRDDGVEACIGRPGFGKAPRVEAPVVRMQPASGRHRVVDRHIPCVEDDLRVARRDSVCAHAVGREGGGGLTTAEHGDLRPVGCEHGCDTVADPVNRLHVGGEDVDEQDGPRAESLRRVDLGGALRQRCCRQEARRQGAAQCCQGGSL